MDNNKRGSSRKPTKRNRNPKETDAIKTKRSRPLKAPKVAPVEVDSSTDEPDSSRAASKGCEMKKATGEMTARRKPKSPLKKALSVANIRLAKQAADMPGSNEAGPSTSAASRNTRSPSPSSGSPSAIRDRSARRSGRSRRTYTKSLDSGGAAKPRATSHKGSRSRGGKSRRSRSRRRSRKRSSTRSTTGKRAGKKRRHRSTSAGSDGNAQKKGRKKVQRPKSRPSSRGKRKTSK